MTSTSLSLKDSTEVSSDKEGKRTGIPDFCDTLSSSCTSSDESKTNTIDTKNMKKKKSFPPQQASDWDEDDLAKIGIVYAAEPMELSDIITEIKRNKPNLVELPQLCKKLCEMTQKVWTFSVNSSMLAKDFSQVKDVEQDNPCKPGKQEVKEESKNPNMSEIKYARKKMYRDQHVELIEDTKANFDSMYDDLKEDVSEELRTQGLVANDIFSEWRNRLIGFWNFFSSLVKRLVIMPWQMEGRYSELFKRFCRVFFLQPEGGEVYKVKTCVKSAVVRGAPDVRFVDEDAQKVIVVTEVKHQKDHKQFDYETFTHKEIPSHVLGRHGIQLLLEIPESFFRPYIVGIICIGTQLVFTSLCVDYEDLVEIQSKKEVSSPHSYIFYTRPYDFMIEADRKEIFEHLFWFGVLQHGSRMDTLI